MISSGPSPQPPNQVSWATKIPESEWQLYREVLDRALAAGIRFAIGGGFAFSNYSRRWRNTKDIDLYVLPEERQALIDAVSQAGFHDLYEQKPYERHWIYRGTREGVIVDVIWQMANRRAAVDETWLTLGQEISLHGLTLRLLPAEELLWAKLYIIQRERCDWPDLFNILYSEGRQLDWQRLLARVERDVRLLSGLISTFAWLCPARAGEFPGWVWERLGLEPPQEDVRCGPDSERVNLMDTRDWFGPTSTENE